MNGILYGTTRTGGAYDEGTVFSLDPATGAEKVLYSFCAVNFPDCTDGQEPSARLLGRNGLIYGTAEWGGANGGGTVFSLDPATGVETVLHPFCAQQACTDGSNPSAGLIDVDGTLYGTTYSGGDGPFDCDSDNGCGTVFALNPETGEETVLHSFCSQVSCADGALPKAGLIDASGTIYGTTSEGGPNGGGTVFAITP